MLHGSPGPDVGASELTRLLARFADADACDARPIFAERLGHWLSWTGAISLASALNAGHPATPPEPGGVPARAPGAEAATFDRVRATLEAAIAAGPRELLRVDPTHANNAPHAAAVAALPTASTPTEFGPYRRHCLGRQQAMEDAIGALRTRLREALSRSAPAGARLAAIDAVMDQTLTPQERSLLGMVPLRLQAHFERLQRAAADHPDWPAIFRADMDRLLRAELAHRLLPAQGLLDALRTHRPTT